MQSQVEVTKSRKPIKKMINIHVGDAAYAYGWDGLAVLSHTHMNNKSSEQWSPACCNCGVLGGGDQEVNMIQSSSFISLMKVITAYRDKKTARWTKSIYKRPASNSLKPT